MLLSFKMKNFKSFQEEMDFKMIPTSIKDLEYSVLEKEVKGKKIRGLSSAAIYGPNSAGKTNIIGGMEVFRNIVLKGNLENSEKASSSNPAVNRLELIPNIECKKEEPVFFAIQFVVQNLLVDFTLEIALGNFLDVEYDRKILREELRINHMIIYSRGEKLKIGKLEWIQEYLIENFSKETAEKIAQSNLDAKELFFNGMFKNLYSKKLYDNITEWFREKFQIVYHADKMKSVPIITNENREKKYYIDQVLNKAAKNFGLTSEQIAYPISQDKEVGDPVSIIESEKTGKKVAIPAEYFESFGTIRFLSIFPLIVRAIHSGATLVIDELDASIHPMAIMNLIRIFHNEQINTKGAQLVFNTHNPIFLNHTLLRRDEIKFVEKEEKGSIQYSLADFGTNGKNGVRNTEDYMKNYFISKYGAIKDVDFSEIFME